MDDQTSRSPTQRVIDALDASVRDVAEGNLHDARSVQAEARRLLADHERPRRAGSGSQAVRPARRSRSA